MPRIKRLLWAPSVLTRPSHAWGSQYIAGAAIKSPGNGAQRLADELVLVHLPERADWPLIATRTKPQFDCRERLRLGLRAVIHGRT